LPQIPLGEITGLLAGGEGAGSLSSRTPAPASETPPQAPALRASSSPSPLLVVKAFESTPVYHTH